MNLKRYVLLLLSLTAVLCAMGKKGKVELRIWDRNLLMEEVVNRFNTEMVARGEPLKAVFELIPYTQQVPKFMAALSSKTAPDVYSLDIVQYPYFIDQGAFYDISKQAHGLPFYQELPAGLIEVATKEGKIYALPYEVDLSTILVNMDILKKEGISAPPSSWQEMAQIASAVTKDLDGDGNIDQWGTHLPNDAGSLMFWGMPYLWSNGGELIAAGQLHYDSEATRELWRFWHELKNIRKVTPPSTLQADFNAYNLFVSGKLALFHGGNFNLVSLRKDAPNLNFRVIPIPSNSGQHFTFGGGNLIGISSQSKHPQAAWKFIEFALSKTVLLEVFAKDYGLLPRKDLFDNPYYQTLPGMSAFVDILPLAKTPISKNYNKIYEPIFYYFSAAMRNEMPVDQAVHQANMAMNKALKGEE